MAKGTTSDVTPFVGRQAELALLGKHLRSAARNRGRMVGIKGTYGSGKTRLLKEFIVNAKAKKAAAWYVTCIKHENSFPYQPVIEIIQHTLGVDKQRLEPFPALRALMESKPCANKPVQYYMGLITQYGEVQLCWEMYQYLQRLAQDRCVVIVLDDFQWADRSTQKLVEFIADGLAEQKILFLYAYSDLGDDEQGYDLTAFAKKMRRISSGSELYLQGFCYDDISQLIRGKLSSGEKETSKLTELIYKRTQGSPQFVVDVLERLKNVDSKKILQSYCEGQESNEMDLKQRLSELSASEREVVFAAAVLGIAFSRDYVSGMLKIAVKTLEKKLQSLIQKRILQKLQREYRFEHRLMRDSIYSYIEPAKRVALHIAAAHVLEEALLISNQRLEGRIAYHYEAAEQPMKAITYFRRAAALAQAMKAYSEAVTYLENALRIWEQQLASDAVYNEVVEQLGDCYFASGEAEKSLTCYLKLYNKNSIARADLVNKIVQNFKAQGKYIETTQFIQDAKSSFAEDERELAKLNLIEAQMLAFSGQFNQAVRLIFKQIRILKRIEDSGGLLQAWKNVGYICLLQRKLRWSSRFYQNAVTYVHSVADNQIEAELFSDIGFVAMCQENWEKASWYLEKAAEISSMSGYLVQLFEVYFNQGIVFTFTGQWSKATDIFQKALELNMGIGHPYRTVSIYLNLIYITVHQNKLDMVRKYLHRAVRAARQLTLEHERFRWQIYVAFGGYYFMKGRFNRALSFYLKVVEPHKHFGMVNELQHIYLRLAQIHGAIGQTDKAIEYADLASKYLADRGSLFVEYKQGELQYIYGSIYRLKGDYHKARSILLHSLENNVKSGNRLYEGYCNHELSLLYKALGDKQNCENYYQRARTLFNQLEIDDLIHKAYNELIKKAYTMPEGQEGIFSTILQFIDQNFNQPITLEDVATQTYLSASRLRHLIKDKTGYTFKDYVIFLRLKRAEELLKASANNIAEVASMVGFSNQQYFNRLFKQRYGVTPGEYRKSM